LGWLSGWNYRIPITVTNNTISTLMDYQVLITIDTASLISAGKMRSDCGDIRFTDSDGTTIINHWIESGINTTSTRIWVKVPLIPASDSTTIYLYYGNPSATSLSDFANTMIALSANPSFTPYGSYNIAICNIQENPDKTLVPDEVYGYMKTWDAWSAQDEGCYWIWDFGSVDSREFFVKWYASATAISGYCVDFTITISLSADGSTWTSIDSYKFTAGGEIPVRTSSGRGSYRYVKVDQYSTRLCMVNYGYTYVDAVYARKYVSPEPTVSIGSEEIPIIYINISDGATGSDVVRITGQVPLTDVGSGTDVVSIVGYIEKTDEGVGTDIINILGQRTISDTGLGFETILVSKELIVGDTSVGTDTINVFGNIPILDYGLGSEVIQTQSMVNISDYGTGVDLPSINVPLQISDYGTGADTINVGINMPIEDYCVGSEVIDIAFGITIKDYCIGSDIIEISTLIPISDYCIGNDIIRILTSVPINDYGIGNELVNVEGYITINDYATGSDIIVTSIFVPISDYGVGSELINIVGYLSISDYSIGSELVDVKGYINIIDYSLGSEVINIATPINISDYGTGTDVIGIVSGVYITDVGFGVDLVSSWMGANIYDFGKGIDTVDVGLGIVGNVLIDGNNIGEFSYVYKDLYSENLPVQVVRRRLEGDVVIDGEKIGFSQFEWEDRITMEVEGYRTIRIKGLVKLSDVI